MVNALGTVSVVFGGLVWAAGLAGAPIVIHLLLRAKPRRIPLPTMRFVKLSRQAQAHRNRLKHLLLLAMRILAILLVLLLLARVIFLPDGAPAVTRSGAKALVVVVDNSASMSYRFRDNSLLERGKSAAIQLVQALPVGSRVAVLPTCGLGGAGEFSPEPGPAIRQLRDIRQTQGDRPLGEALSRGAALLHRRDDPTLGKEVLIVTDSTAQAWRDEPLTADADDVAFTILDLGVEQDANVAIGLPRLSSGAVPRDVEVSVRAEVFSRSTGGQLTLQAMLNDRPVAQTGVVLEPGGERSVRLNVKPSAVGVVAGELRLSPDDPLVLDNVRFFALEVGAPATVLFGVSRRPTGDTTPFLMTNAVAPPLRPGEGGLQRRSVSMDALDASALDETPLVVLPGVAAVTDKQWASFEAYLRRGGRVWIIAGPATAGASFASQAARAVLPLIPAGQEQLDEPVGLAPPNDTLPMLQPFGDPANPSLTSIRARRRMRVESVAEEAEVVLRYSDDVPAIVRRSVGAGEVLFWNLSPTEQWSNLGRHPAQLVLLSARATEVLLGDAQSGATYHWGRTIVLPFPSGMQSPAAALRRPGRSESEPLDVDLAGRTVRIPAEELGVHAVTFSEAGRVVTCGFAVNVPSVESRLVPEDPQRLEGFFPSGTLLTVRSAEAYQQLLAVSGGRQDLTPLLLPAVVLLLIGESWFANRFYKQPVGTVLAGTSGGTNCGE
jgi:hypothetical protein